MLEAKLDDKYKRVQVFVVSLYLNLISFGLPLIVNNGYYNITETKSVYFLSLSLFLILTTTMNFFIKIRKKKGLNLNFISLDIPVLLFSLINFLSAMFSEYQSDVWFGENSRYQGAAMILLYVLVYFVVSRNYSSSQSFLLCLLFSFSIVSLLGVLNCFNVDTFCFYSSLSQGYKKTYISTIGNINFYSSYMCLIFPVVVYGYCQTKKRLSRAIYTVVLIIGSFGIMVTSSESFVIGFSTAMIVIPFLLNEKEKLKKFFGAIILIILSTQIYLFIYKMAEKKNIKLSQLLDLLTSPIVLIVSVFLIIIFLLLLHKKLDWYKRTYLFFTVIFFISLITSFVLSNTIGLGILDKVFKITEDWGTYRGGIWKQLLTIFSEFDLKEKFFGIGPEALYNITEPLEIHGNLKLDQAHNEYLQYLMTTGILGLLSYISLIITILVSVVKKLKHNTLALALIIGLISYWVQAIVNIAQPITTPIMYIFVACIGGMLYNKRENVIEITSEKMFNIEQNKGGVLNGIRIKKTKNGKQVNTEKSTLCVYGNTDDF